MPPIRTKKRIRRKKCHICGPTESTVCRFPVEEERLAQWCTFCNVSPSTVSKSSRLCIRHFEAKDVIYRGVNRPCLKSDAVPSIYAVAEVKNLTAATTNDDGNLKISIRNNLKSILSKGNLVPHTCHASRADITPPSRALCIRYPNSNTLYRNTSTDESESNVASPMADVSSSNFEIISIDLSGNETLHVEKGVPVEASYTSGVQSEPHSTTADSTAVSPLNIRNTEGKNCPGVQVTPTVNRENHQPVRNTARALRYIADIKSPDLESPKRREECLKIIRYEHQKTRRKMQSLQQQNQRLKAKLHVVEACQKMYDPLTLNLKLLVRDGGTLFDLWSEGYVHVLHQSYRFTQCTSRRFNEAMIDLIAVLDTLLDEDGHISILGTKDYAIPLTKEFFVLCP